MFLESQVHFGGFDVEPKQISNNNSNNSNLFILQKKRNISKKIQTWKFQIKYPS